MATVATPDHLCRALMDRAPSACEYESVRTMCPLQLQRRAPGLQATTMCANGSSVNEKREWVTVREAPIHRAAGRSPERIDAFRNKDCEWRTMMPMDQPRWKHHPGSGS